MQIPIKDNTATVEVAEEEMRHLKNGNWIARFSYGERKPISIDPTDMSMATTAPINRVVFKLYPLYGRREQFSYCLACVEGDLETYLKERVT